MRVHPSDRLQRERVRALPRREGDPLHRRLRIFAIDPTLRQDEGGLATVRIPYERVGAGPIGERFRVEMADPHAMTVHPGVDLERPEALIEHGLAPSMTRKEFAGQMVYGVAMSLYDSFSAALGRELPLGLRRVGGEWLGGDGLRLQPFGSYEAQASFDSRQGAIRFGYHAARRAAKGYSPQAEVYTCLSHDIVVHELTHAFLHALRPRLEVPFNADVLALHEGFADLVAIFQRLRYGDFVTRNIERSGAVVAEWEWLCSLAGNFSQAIGIGPSLRQLTEFRLLSDATDEPHDRGLVLVQAVFDAFTRILQARIDRVVLLASGGSGVLPEGQLPPVVVKALSQETQKTAAHLQTMLIRAFDYLPPIAPRFGDYLRGMLTADRVIVPDDSLRYRQHIIDAFRRRGIFPTGHDGRSRRMHMTDDGLCIAPLAETVRIPSLSFGAAGYSGDPAAGEVDGAADHLEQLGHELSTLLDPAAAGDGAGALAHYLELEGVADVTILSLRPYRKLGPEGRVIAGSVCELAWHRDADPLGEDGALILTDAHGRIDHVIAHERKADRRERERAFQKSFVGRRFWERAADSDALVPRPGQFGLLCQGPV